MKQEDVGREAGLSTTSMNKWSQRFARHGLEGLKDPPGRGRNSPIPLEKMEQGVTPAGQALEFAHHGGGGLGVERAAYLAAQRPRAPSALDLQALEQLQAYNFNLFVRQHTSEEFSTGRAYPDIHTPVPIHPREDGTR